MVGTTGATGTPKPAAGLAKDDSPWSEQARRQWSEDVHAQHKARDCVRLRRVLSETKHAAYRARQAYEREMRQLGCAYLTEQEEEDRCAQAVGDPERAEACRYDTKKKR